MKQFKIFMITVVALALAMPALAAVNVKVKGDWQNYFSYTNNAQFYATGDTAKDNKDSDFLYISRTRLTWIAEDDEKKVRGTFGFEIDMLAGYDGRSTDGDGNLDKNGTRNGPGGDFEGDNTNFEVRYAYIDFELPFDAPTRVYMGLQSAEMNPFVFCDNAMGVRVTRSVGPVDLAVGWFRNDTDDSGGLGGDGKDSYADMATLDATFNVNDNVKIGGFAYFMDDGNGYNGLYSNDSFGDQWEDYTDGAGGVLSSFDADASVQVYWIGANASVEAGPMFASATAIYQGGTAQNGSKEDGGDADIKAYLGHLEIGAKIDKVSFAVGGLYMSGDDDVNDSDVENFFGIDIDNTLIPSVVLLEYLEPNGLHAFYGPQVGVLGAQHFYGYVNFEVAPKTELRLAALWYNSAEDVNGEDNLGYEFNAQVTHKITKNLSFALGGGYLIGDDLWDELAENGDSDDLWKVVSMFRYKF